MKRRLRRISTAVLCLLLTCTMVAPQFPIFAVTTEQEGLTLSTEGARTEGTTDLKDYSMPSNEKHAYDPFAQMESEEATKVYRDSVKYEEGTLIYKLSGTKGWFSALKEGADAQALEKLGIDLSSAQPLAKKKTSNGFFTDEYETTYVASFEGDVWQAIDALSQMEGVVAAQPNYLYEDTALDLPTVQKNPDKDKQWHHGPDHLECDKHWQHMHDEDVTPGENVVVAVIDTGVDYTHPDLVSNMWVNVAEQNGTQGVDDDGNGYVDDIYGCSTVGAKYYHSGDPMDDNAHGTHVAGIIAMTANNGEGGVGMAYGARIMAIKAGQATGIFSDTDIAEAINYAVAMGADVINMSFGGTGKSFLVEEALSNAFSSCVLIAAAGNDGIPTADAPEDFMKKADFYPAGYNYVIGVMATDQSGSLAGFSNWDYYGNGGSAEYELTAPGVDIYSTVPGGGYASWDGTSMAAPVVSAAAAMIRSKYADKSVYSSRFIMGQLASATEDLTRYESPVDRSVHIYAALNLDDSLNKLPKPNITVKNTYLFDDPAIDPANDGDGIIDAGELIHMGIVLRNQWGMATDVTVTVDALSSGGVANPHIEFLTDTVSFENIGTFNEQNNSFIYEEGVLVGVEKPIVFRVKSDTVNDAHIGLNITVNAKNALDPEDENTYSAVSSAFFFVQRGRAISGTVYEDLTMTAEDYWIIENSLYIPEGVTVKVEPGTQIQFWSSDANDPYAIDNIAYVEVDGDFIVNGTEEAPVEMFPSIAYACYSVDIRTGLEYNCATNSRSVVTGKTELNYVNVINPRLNVTNADHLYGVQTDDYISIRLLSGINTYDNYYGGAQVIARSVSNSIFTNLLVRNGNINGQSEEYFAGDFDTVTFERCRGEMMQNGGEANSIYQQMTTENCVWLGSSMTVYNPTFGVFANNVSAVYTEQERKYVVVFSEATPRWNYDSYEEHGGYTHDEQSYVYAWHFYQALAEQLDGTLACINSEEELEYLKTVTQAEDEIAGARYEYTLGAYWNDGADSLVWADGSDTYQVEVNKEHPFVRLDDGSLWRSSMVVRPVLEFSSAISDEDIIAHMTDRDNIAKAMLSAQDYLNVHTIDSFNNNAILNEFLSGKTNGWTTLSTRYSDRKSVLLAQKNYFGTENKNLLRKQVIDADVYASLTDIVTDPILTLDSPELESIYPFVTEAYVTDMEGNRIESCSKGQTVQFHVKFNRDMDTTVSPMVSYGPAAPYTDYVINGAFVSDREWVGEARISAVIDAGSEFIRVKDAVSADDAWLKTGTDEGRFLFEISSTGAQAMVLQAQGGENKITLSWMQDDYDTLAGFNVYRAVSADGAFEKINSRLIPGTIREFTDEKVEPGKEYFYYFTVLTTDLAESPASNIAAATPVDNVKPTLSHKRVTEAKYGQAVSFTATASDNVAVDYVKVFYRGAGQSDYRELTLSQIESGSYYGVITASELSLAGLEYYVEVSDGTSLVRDGSPDYPISVSVDGSPAIYAVTPMKVDLSAVKQGVTATLTGVNFTEDMTLTVGGKQVPYVLEGETVLTFTVPEGQLGRVDIALTKNGRTVTLRNALTYVDMTSSVQITAPTELKAGRQTRLPVIVTAKGEILGLDLQFEYDRSLFSSVSFEKAEGLTGAYASFNSYTGKLSLACTAPIPEGGLAGYLVFTPHGVTEACYTTVRILSAKINAVDCASTVDCALCILPSFTVSGKISYYGSGAGMAGVKVMLSDGQVTYTDEQGNYRFEGVSSPNVTVIPCLEGKVNGALSAQDGALVLESITAEQSSLTDLQFIAADVDGDGVLTALDAAYILQKSVGILEGSFPGSGAEWYFDGAKSFTLTANKSGVDFTGILLGDVTGNWSAAAQE